MTNDRSRRRFLRNAAVLGGGAACFGGGLGSVMGHLARAQDDPDAPDMYYVFCYFAGGWDVLLSLDPRDPAAFPADSVADHRIMPGYELLPAGFQDLVRPAGSDMVFGPYIGELANHWDKLAIVRGISMETLTHETGRRRFLTGKPPSGLQARGSSATTHLAAKLGAADAIPQLSVRVESYNNTGLPTYASALNVNSSSDLVDLLQRQTPLLEGLDEEVALTLAAQADCERQRHSPLLRSAEENRIRSRDLLSRGLHQLFDFRSSEPDIVALRERYGIATNDLSGSAAQAAIAAQSLIHGVARVVSISPAGGNLDTHFSDWSRDQGPNQMRGLDAVARLLDHLAETPFKDTSDSWLDHTVVMGFSEFMRTPLINERGGRDHWLCNACFVAGGGIRGGTVVGAASDIGMSPQKIDLETGRPSAAGEVIRPEHVLRTLLVGGGVADDQADLRVGPIPALMA